MTDREIMMKAMRALEDCLAFLERDVPTIASGPERRAATAAITFLGKRLAQHEALDALIADSQAMGAYDLQCKRCGKAMGGPEHIHTCSPQHGESA